jgi:ribulose-5-phosphate 4-epimerase/fuculose-1-phosphate aldolase
MSHSSSSSRLLAKLGRRFGRHLTLVQAAGGNISIKRDTSRIMIKASGVRLREMTSTFGWAEADYPYITNDLYKILTYSSYNSRERAYTNLLQKATRTPQHRISMETGFHAILPGQYVFHLHSISGILVGMMPLSKALRLIESVCTQPVEVHFVAASLPGFELTSLMMKSLKKHKGERIQLWIQRNHGVVWSGGDKGEILRQIDIFEQGLQAYFQLKEFTPPHLLGTGKCSSRPIKSSLHKDYEVTRSVCFCHWPRCNFFLKPLFPDFVIYFNLWSSTSPDLLKLSSRVAAIGAASSLQWKDKMEVLYAHVLVSTLSQSLGWCKPLPKRMIGRLKTMELERLRQKQILKI